MNIQTTFTNRAFDYLDGNGVLIERRGKDIEKTISGMLTSLQKINIHIYIKHGDSFLNYICIFYSINVSRK